MFRQTAVDDLIARAFREVDDGLLPSCQLAVGFEGEVVESVTLGDTPAADDTRYVMFSCTKAVVVSAVWQLLAEGSLHLSDRIGDLIPEFATNGKDVITLEQVLLHTSGFPHAPLGPPSWADRNARLQAFSRWRLNWQPGTAHEYHATSAHWILAELLCRVDGVEHTESVKRRVLEPLGLKSMALGVAPEDQDDVATVVSVGEPATSAELQQVLGVAAIDVGEVTDEALLLLAEPANLQVGVPGGGGVTTAADLVRFYQAVLHNRDSLWDPAILASAKGEVRNTFPDPQLGVPANRTVGLVVRGDDANATRRGFGYGASPATFGHNGAGGQLAWADPETGLSFAYLTNGLDRHVIREARRGVGLSSRAAAVVKS
ncbi:MAG: serine hydrolase domain-containing protein [Acidimicrobiales bacterium]